MNSGSFFDNFTGSRIITDTPHSNSSMLSGAISHLRMITSPMVKSTMNSPSLCLALTGNEEIDRIRGELEGVKGRDDEYESRSGSDNIDGGSGDDQDLENPPKRKRYHRHTPQQIQELEALFKECPHPDEKQRLELGRRLNLEPRQVKFWFQNRRTQMKTQLERHENSILRQENDKLRAENLSIRDAIRNPVCSHCGGPAVLGELSLEEQQLRIENARLRDELERVCALTGKFMTHPILTSSHHVSNSSLDLTIKDDGFGGSASDYGSTPSQLSLVSTTKSSSVSCTDHTERSLERSMFLELALAAMDELVKLVQMDEPIWMPGLDDGMDVLNFEEYTKMFPRCIDAKPVGFVSEATRETGMVIISSLALIETLMDGHRWLEMFPGLVVRSSVTEVVSSGVGGTKNGAIQLMHAEFQVLSPLVPICEANFLRFSKQHAEGIWAVVDVSIDGIRETPVNSSYMGCRRLPSGCLVQSMPNGYTKVTCVEHREYDESQVHHLYRSYLLSGKGFGAGRWLSTLQRHCQFLATFISPTNDSSVMSLTGRRNLLKLAQRMMSIFCGGVCASPDQKWSKLCIGNVGDDVRVMTRKSVDNPGEPSGVILNAATSVWLPGETEHLFDFLRNDGLRSQWDILSNGGPMHKMANIPKGHDQRNCVSLLRSNAMSATQNSMLILQETCIDAAGSLVIYAPVDVPAMNAVMNGGDPSFVALLPSGFAIVPACERSSTNTTICPATGMSGSLLTVAFQILVNSLPTAKLTVESVETVNNLISCTIQKIKAALQCDT